MRDMSEFDALFARLDDLCGVAERGEVAVSQFLSPRELHFASAHLGKRGAHFLCFGGYDGAERQRIYLLPDYMDSVENAREICDFGMTLEISAIRITSGNYKKLSHRDFLGSALGLGIERSVLGDILVDEDSSALMLCDAPIEEFLLMELLKVGNEKVKTASVPLEGIKPPERKFAAINDTVASPRVDCIVGALCSLSREKAKEAVLAGLVEVDFEAVERPDKIVSAPSLVSVRGFGRFRVVAASDLTKKGRYRLVAEKFL